MTHVGSEDSGAGGGETRVDTVSGGPRKTIIPKVFLMEIYRILAHGNSLIFPVF